MKNGFTNLLKLMQRKDEDLNFKQLNFRMADASNLKINECSNVERPNSRDSLNSEKQN